MRYWKILLLFSWIVLFSVAVDASPSTTITAIDENSDSYSSGDIHLGEYINISLSCTDCNETFYCLSEFPSCEPDIVYEESLQFFETRYIRYYSTNGTVNETTDTFYIVINTEPKVISYNLTENVTAVSLQPEIVDAEDNANTTYSYWYVNGTYLSDYFSFLFLNSTEYDVGDSVGLIHFVGDGQFNSTPVLNLTAIIGDTTPPTILSYEMVPDTTPTLTETLQTTVEDNSTIKNIRHFFTRPNGSVEIVEQYVFQPREDGTYSNLYRFDTIGEWVYNKIEVEDEWGNLESFTINRLFRVLSSIGGGGGGGTPSGGTVIVEEGLNISQFYVNPTVEDVYMSAGTTRIPELEIVNTYIDEITVNIRMNPDDIAYDWMSFSDDRIIRELSLDIPRQGGIAGNSRFVQYYIEVPEDVENGVYEAEILVSTEDEESVYTVNVRVGTNPLLEFLTRSIYREGNINITYGLIILVLIVGTVVVVTYVNARRQAQEERRRRQ